MKTLLIIAFMFSILVNIIISTNLKTEDYISSKSNAYGKSSASKKSNAATVITSTAAANKDTNKIYNSKNAAALNFNTPITNFS